MPIDKTMSDAMLGTFRQLLNGCKEKKYSGESFNSMCNIMEEMEQLAKNTDDFVAFSSKLTTGGYFVNFSNEYGKLLSESAMQATGGSYNDAALLEQTITQYENSLKQYEDQPDKEMLTFAVRNIIDLGRSGVNYPTFLRKLIENGLDKAMEGTILNRKYLLQDVERYDKMLYPPMQRRSRAVLKKYDEMAAASAVRIPDTNIFFLMQAKIISDTAVDQSKYDHIQKIWFAVFTGLHTWIDAYTRFAMTDERYAGKSAFETQQNIERCKNELPGKIAVWQQQLLENYQLKWGVVFTHESFESATKSGRFNYTENYISFVKEKLSAACIIGAAPDMALIQEASSLYFKALKAT